MIQGDLLPAIPCKKTEGTRGLSMISTIHTRASYCSLALRAKVGQSWAPGISSLRRLRNWQPLQTPETRQMISRIGM